MRASFLPEIYLSIYLSGWLVGCAAIIIAGKANIFSIKLSLRLFLPKLEEPPVRVGMCGVGMCGRAERTAESGHSWPRMVGCRGRSQNWSPNVTQTSSKSFATLHKDTHSERYHLACPLSSDPLSHTPPPHCAPPLAACRRAWLRVPRVALQPPACASLTLAALCRSSQQRPHGAPQQVSRPAAPAAAPSHIA